MPFICAECTCEPKAPSDRCGSCRTDRSCTCRYCRDHRTLLRMEPTSTMLCAREVK